LGFGFLQDRLNMTISRWSNYSPDVVAQHLWDVVRFDWYLGFTAFGGPPVHFKIVRKGAMLLVPQNAGKLTQDLQFHDKYVNKLNWISEQMVAAF
jgi:hypothetical protein